jgi:hypothetical protein
VNEDALDRGPQALALDNEDGLGENEEVEHDFVKTY